MKDKIHKIINSKVFHNVYVAGCCYRTFACCGKEQFTVVESSTPDTYHVCHTEAGYAFSVHAPDLLEQNISVIQRVVANGVGSDGVVTFSSWEIIKDELVEECIPACDDPRVIFEYGEGDSFYLDKVGLKMITDKGTARTRNKLRGEQFRMFDLVNDILY